MNLKNERAQILGEYLKAKKRANGGGGAHRNI